MSDDNAQMLVVESIFFGITVIVALAFLTQISPSSIQSGTKTSNELKIIGDGALDALYTQTTHIKENELNNNSYKTNNPTSKLVVFIITNNYTGLIDSLNGILPSSILYNIYISNGTKTVYWCNSTGPPIYPTDGPLPMMDPIAISHHPIPMDPKYLSPASQGGYTADTYLNYITGDRSDIFDDFLVGTYPYYGSTYEVILEMSSISG